MVVSAFLKQTKVESVVYEAGVKVHTQKFSFVEILGNIPKKREKMASNV